MREFLEHPIIKLSIITVSYNSAHTIRDTIESVLAQDHPDIEYIIIDGGSTDGTVDIIGEYGSQIDIFFSEGDSGIYDGMNKGLHEATGDVVAFLNSDDFYPCHNIASAVMSEFQDPNVDACYGDLRYVSRMRPERAVRCWRSREFESGLFGKGWCPPHPTFFVRRLIYERYGVFDLSLRLAADVELMIRFLEVKGITARYIPRELVHMRVGGATNESLGNIFRQNGEVWRALEHHGVEAGLLQFLRGKVASRGIQYFRGWKARWVAGGWETGGGDRGNG